MNSLRLALLSSTMATEIPLNMEQISSVFLLKTCLGYESVLWEIESPVRRTVSKYNGIVVSE